MNGTRLLALVLGFWLLMRAVNKDATGRTLIDKIVGNKASQSPLLPLGSAYGSSDPGATPNAKGQVNPVPGATGSRLDQGFDLTSRNFFAPFNGKVVVSKQSDPGWKGGGYVAIQNQTDPSQVVYFAEGIAPIVFQGDTVQAGQRIGTPIGNPYNQVLGNIETGPANPANPSQPLAQVARNPAAAVQSFYQWLLGLGGPRATSTSGAGYA